MRVGFVSQCTQFDDLNFSIRSICLKNDWWQTRREVATIFCHYLASVVLFCHCECVTVQMHVTLYGYKNLHFSCCHFGHTLQITAVRPFDRFLYIFIFLLCRMLDTYKYINFLLNWIKKRKRKKNVQCAQECTNTIHLHSVRRTVWI